MDDGIPQRVTDKVRGRGALVILLGGAVAIGFAPLFVRWSEVGPIATGSWRVLLAAPVFWLGMGYRERRAEPARRKLTPRDMLVLCIPGLFFAGDLGFWHWSLKLTTVVNATFFANCAPIVVALIGWLWLKERLGLSFVGGLVLGLAGAGLMILFNPHQGSNEHSLLGDGLGLLTAVFYGGYQLSVKRLRARYPTLTIMGFSTTVSAIVLGVAAWFSGETLIPLTVSGFLVLLALGLVCQVGGQGSIAYALGHLPVSFASVSLLFQPLVTAAAGWAILGEAVGGWQGMGGVCVLLGIYLARCGSNSQQPWKIAIHDSRFAN